MPTLVALPPMNPAAWQKTQPSMPATPLRSASRTLVRVRGRIRVRARVKARVRGWGKG